MQEQAETGNQSIKKEKKKKKNFCYKKIKC